MKVSIYLTQYSKNLKEFYVDHVQDMAAQVTDPFQTKTQFVCLRHEWPMTWVQCQLGTPVATKRHLSKSFVINGFLINQEHITCLSWAATRLVYGLGGQN